MSNVRRTFDGAGARVLARTAQTAGFRPRPARARPHPPRPAARRSRSHSIVDLGKRERKRALSARRCALLLDVAAHLAIAKALLVARQKRSRSARSAAAEDREVGQRARAPAKC